MNYLNGGYIDKAIDELVLELKANPENEAAGQAKRTGRPPQPQVSK